MKLLSKISFCLAITILLSVSSTVSNAQTVYPRISQKGMVMQTIGDTDVMITYHRPNVRGRTLWGSKDEKALVPNGVIWRAGANEATIFEVSNDVMINGEKLPKGKYSFYTIPGKNEWTLIFNKSWNQGGTTYNQEEDALRVTAKPVMSDVSIESLRYSLENVMETKADVHLSWGNARIPFTVDVGDLDARIFKNVQATINGERINVANYVLSTKQADKYKMAVSWLDSILADGENYGAYFVKSRLLGEMGMKTEAIETAKKGVAFGKANNVNPGNVDFLQSLIDGWMKK